VKPPRVCPACQTPEVRTVLNGRESVNLDPFTDYCVDCLIACAREARQLPPDRDLFTAPVTPSLDFDARAAAANDRGEP
jgi:hypothetical protein